MLLVTQMHILSLIPPFDTWSLHVCQLSIERNSFIGRHGLWLGSYQTPSVKTHPAFLQSVSSPGVTVALKLFKVSCGGESIRHTHVMVIGKGKFGHGLHCCICFSEIESNLLVWALHLHYLNFMCYNYDKLLLTPISLSQNIVPSTFILYPDSVVALTVDQS